MFDLGFGELLLVGLVALIVVGPKDLPKMFRQVGQFTGKARQMAREFSRAMNDAADDAGVNDINKTLRAAANPMKAGTDAAKSAAGFGPATQKLSEEREAAKQKILESSARAAEARIAREKAAAEAPASAAPDPAPAPEQPPEPPENKGGS